MTNVTHMNTATREDIIDGACTLIIDCYEGFAYHWAVANGTYRWANDGVDYQLGKKTTHASVTLYEEDKCELVEEDDPSYGNEEEGFFGWGGFYKFGEPLYIDQDIVADFIVKACTEGIDDDHLPDYGRLGNTALQTIRGIYFGDDDPFGGRYDGYVADSIIQFILLGEVVYG